MPNDDGKSPFSRVTQHLANERTFLAWLRTSLSILTLGFATNRFARFLIDLRARTGKEPLTRSLFGDPGNFGLGMVIFGTSLLVGAAIEFERTKRAIDTGSYRASSGLVWIVAVLSATFGITAMVLMLQQP